MSAVLPRSNQLLFIGRAFVELKAWSLVEAIAEIRERVPPYPPCTWLGVANRNRRALLMWWKCRYGGAPGVQMFQTGDVPAQAGVRQLKTVRDQALPDVLDLVTFAKGTLDLRPEPLHLPGFGPGPLSG
jgi:hypothetical protein